MSGKKQSTSTSTRVIDRITDRGPGWIFTPADFADLGTSQAVRLALMNAERSGAIRRLARGLYEMPRKHTKLGKLAPSVDAVAMALQSRDASRLQPTGAYAANLLGLSEQVPARIIFFTDGRPRTVTVGNQQIVLLRRSTRTMATAGRTSGLVISALDYLGKENVDSGIINQLRAKLSPEDRRKLLADARYAPAWIGDILRSLANEVASPDNG